MSKVYLVGAGPGDPGLITVRGLGILRQADAVIYDYLVDRRLLESAKKGAELVCCGSLGKKRHPNTSRDSQEKISRLLVKKAREGKRVVRLKNGDPSIFSRISHELDALVRNGIEFEVVPGVTAASAAACFSGVPLTDRGFSSEVVFLTGHEEGSKAKSSINWKAIAGCRTIVLYMAVGNIRKTVGRLLGAGLSAKSPVVAVSDAGGMGQRNVRAKLGDIAKVIKKEGVRAPAIIIIGETASLAGRFDWLGRSRRVLFTGLSNERFFIKGKYFHLPLVSIGPLPDYSEFDGCLEKIGGFDWTVFSSRYGVEHFFRRFKTIGFDSRKLAGIKVAAVGSSTASRLEDFGIVADLVPKKESAEGLLEAFEKIGLEGKRIFLPRSDLSDKGLAKGLGKLGARVSPCIAYKNVMPARLPDLDLDYFDEIMFTSPSGVRNFVKRYGRPPKRTSISCIGGVTRGEARRCRLLG